MFTIAGGVVLGVIALAGLAYLFGALPSLWVLVMVAVVVLLAAVMGVALAFFASPEHAPTVFWLTFCTSLAFVFLKGLWDHRSR